MKFNGIIFCSLVMAAPAALATHFPPEPQPGSAEENACQTLCGEREEPAMQACDYLPPNTPKADRDQCYRRVQGRLDACMAGCGPSYLPAGENEFLGDKTPDYRDPTGRSASSSLPPDVNSPDTPGSYPAGSSTPSDPGCGIPDTPDTSSGGNGGGVDPGCGIPDYPGV